MAKKTKINFNFDCSLFCIFSLISTVIVLLDVLLLKGKVLPFFASPVAGNFSFSDPLSYIKILFHVLGANASSINGLAAWIFALIFSIAMGTEEETVYGTVFLTIMILISSIFSGVLAACVLKTPLTSAIPVVFLLLFLRLFAGLKKHTLAFSSILYFAGVCAFCLILKSDVIELFINIAGGLCGGILSFLAVPNRKPKNSKKAPAQKTQTKVTYHNDNDDDTTVIGTFNL